MFKNFIFSKKIIYLFYCLFLIAGALQYGFFLIALGGFSSFNFFTIPYLLSVALGNSLRGSLSLFLSLIVIFNLIQFLYSRLLNKFSNNNLLYYWINFALVLFSCIYLYLVFPLYIRDIGLDITQQYKYNFNTFAITRDYKLPIIFPQAYFLLSWIIYDFVGFFVKKSNKTNYFKPLINYLQITILIFSLIFIELSYNSEIKSYFKSKVVSQVSLETTFNNNNSNKSITKIYNEEYIDDEHILVTGDLKLVNEKVGGKITTVNGFLGLRNINTKEYAWVINEGSFLNISNNKKIIYILVDRQSDDSSSTVKIPVNILEVDSLTGTTIRSISLEDKNVSKVIDLVSNLKDEAIALIQKKDINYQRSGVKVFNLSKNVEIIEFKNDWADYYLSPNGKYLAIIHKNIYNDKDNLGFYSIYDIEEQKEIFKDVLTDEYSLNFEMPHFKNENFTFVTIREKSKENSGSTRVLVSIDLIAKKSLYTVIHKDTILLGYDELTSSFNASNDKGDRIAQLKDYSIKIYKVENDQTKFLRTLELPVNGSKIKYGFSFKPNSNTLKLNTDDGEVLIYEIE